MASTNPFRRLLHWGPISVVCIIKLITWAMIHVLSMWWPPQSSILAALHSLLFLALAATTLYYFLQSLLEGPGFVPQGWRPEIEEHTEFLQYCTVCRGYKAPRSHHCSKCGRCVKKMDHHCPWINTCVGHSNHCYFMMFLTAAVLGCLHATCVLPICVYHSLNAARMLAQSRHPIVFLSLPALIAVLLAVGMALGVVLAVSVLLYFQVRGALRNQTNIEEWILEKATYRRDEQKLPPFVFPYDLGWRRNLSVLFSSSDGLQWSLKDGCGPYDLTCEQISQKADKRDRSRLYTAIRAYNGRWLPVLSRPRATVGAPCTDEPRLPLQPGDHVRATRHRKHWLFGYKVVNEGSERGPRGWFPRDSVVLTDTLPSTLDTLASGDIITDTLASGDNIPGTTANDYRKLIGLGFTTVGVNTNDDVNKALEALYQIFYNALDESTPRKKPKAQSVGYSYPKWYSAEIIRDIQQKAKWHKKLKPEPKAKASNKSPEGTKDLIQPRREKVCARVKHSAFHSICKESPKN